MGFFNTIGFKGKKLKEATENCKNQNDKILFLFESKSERGFTPCEVHAIYIDVFEDVPLTSIRRGITQLTLKGKLSKTLAQRVGKYGKENYVWILKNGIKES